MKKIGFIAIMLVISLSVMSCSKKGVGDETTQNNTEAFKRDTEPKEDEAKEVIDNIYSDNVSILISEKADQEKASKGIEIAEKAYAYMFVDDSDSVYEMMDERLQELVDPVGLKEEWAKLIEDAGKMERIYQMSVLQQEGFTIITSKIKCENANLQMVTSTEDDNPDKLLGFQFTVLPEADAIEKDLPSGVSEIDIIVNSDGDFALRGKLTLPSGASSTNKVPAAVLVNGSGASDMDEHVYAYKPLRDIAYGLAEDGVASIRFEKRNYLYPNADFSTVETELVEDVVAATKLLMSYDEIDTSKVYAVGHSMGGMLVPRIDVSGGNYHGYVLIASSPYNLGEVSMHQAEAQIEKSKAFASTAAQAQSDANFKAEVEKLDSIKSSTSEALARSAIAFGINGYYLQDFKKHDQIEIIKKEKKPTFIIQGENDASITMDVDFAEYKKELSGENYVTLKSYPGLNHFFAPSKGESAEPLEEYMTPSDFDRTAISDISEFIKNS